MKNLFLFLAIISLVSCQDDIQSSSPTLQGLGMVIMCGSQLFVQLQLISTIVLK